MCKMFGMLKHNTIYPFLLKVCEDYQDVQRLYTSNLDTQEKECLKALVKAVLQNADITYNEEVKR